MFFRSLFGGSFSQAAQAKLVMPLRMAVSLLQFLGARPRLHDHAVGRLNGRCRFDLCPGWCRHLLAYVMPLCRKAFTDRQNQLLHASQHQVLSRWPALVYRRAVANLSPGHRLVPSALVHRSQGQLGGLRRSRHGVQYDEEDESIDLIEFEKTLDNMSEVLADVSDSIDGSESVEESEDEEEEDEEEDDLDGSNLHILDDLEEYEP
jgi:hypothetical protein